MKYYKCYHCGNAPRRINQALCSSCQRIKFLVNALLFAGILLVVGLSMMLALMTA